MDRDNRKPRRQNDRDTFSRGMFVEVRNNDVGRAMRKLKKMMIL